MLIETTQIKWKPRDIKQWFKFGLPEIGIEILTPGCWWYWEVIMSWGLYLMSETSVLMKETKDSLLAPSTM